MLLLIIVGLVLSVPLWIDPMTLRELTGGGPMPTPTPSASPTSAGEAPR